jgi:putative tricarboxylic transport membrane protein
MKKIFPIPLGHFFAGLFWLAVAILVFVGIAPLPAAEGGGIGPASFPRILGFSLLGLGLLYWVQSRQEKKVEVFGEEREAVHRVALLLALSYGTASLWEAVGALPVLILLCFVELKWVEGYSWKKAVPVGLILAAGVWLVFTRLLGVSLPYGVLIWLY